MLRFLVPFATVLALAGAALSQPDAIQRGKLKKIDADGLTLTITAGGKDHEFTITDDTRVFGAEGKPLKERLATLKVGSDVMFKPGSKGGKTILVGVKAVTASDRPMPTDAPKFDSSKLKALTDLEDGKYHDFEGGLYPGGKSKRPAAHEKAGIALAGQVQPLDAEGKPSPDGKIVLLSVGMSNTSQASDGFARLLGRESDRNPRLVFVNGAQGGMTAKATQDPDDKASGTRFWTTIDQRLKAAGLTPAQVQAVWIKQADAGPTQGFPAYAETLRDELAKIVRVLPQRFPNVKMAYLSSRTYGGYARSRLNPEPYAYESGFSVKWLIEQQIKGEPSLNFDAALGPVKAPWLSWGPYLWANAMAARGDGFSWAESDFAGDGTHESPSGQAKVGGELLKFFKSDATTRSWFTQASRLRQRPE